MASSEGITPEGTASPSGATAVRPTAAARPAAAIRPLDHRDAIRDHDPLTRLGGLALEFVTKVVASPMALFLLVDEHQCCRMAAIKADPVLASDSVALERDCVEAICATRPVLGLPSGFGQNRVLDTAGLQESEIFNRSTFATGFLPAYGLGPMLMLLMKEKGTGATCVMGLIRSVEEQEFNDREKSFLRQMAPLLTQSWSCASGVAAGPGFTSPGGTDLAGLTPRETEIARLAGAGARNEEIAESLHIASGTVKCHIRNIYAKLGIDSRVHLSLLLAER